MRSSNLIFFTFAIVCSLAQRTNAQDQNKPWPFKINSHLQSVFFHEETFDYPANIVQHADGTLENIEGGSITNPEKQLITADCESNYLPAEHKIKFAEAFLDEQNNLTIRLKGATQSTREVIRLTQVNHGFAIDYQTENIVFTEKANWQVEKAKIVLTTQEFFPDTQLNAYIDLQLEGITRFGSKIHTRIHGYIKPKITSRTK